jgi:hypothetical protein
MLCYFQYRSLRYKNNMADQNHEIFFVTKDEKYQTCLLFGLHVTNDENAVNVARTRGNFVDPTCHE